MYILRPIIDLVADPAVCQRAVLTEGLQSTGGGVQQKADLLGIQPFPHSLLTELLTEFICNPGCIFQILQHTFKDCRFNSDDFHKRIQLVRNKYSGTTIFSPNACRQMSSDFIRWQEQDKTPRYSACGKAKKPRCRHKDYAEQREQKSLSSHGAESFLTRYCRTHVFRYSTCFYGDIKEACLFINDTVYNHKSVLKSIGTVSSYNQK